jgi:hypothetical protein
MNREQIEKELYDYKIGDILNKYPKRLKDKVINRIITNLKLRNPEYRKHKVKLEDVIREIFADGLTEMDIKNKKIEAAIKLSKGEITEDEFINITDIGKEIYNELVIIEALNNIKVKTENYNSKCYENKLKEIINALRKFDGEVINKNAVINVIYLVMKNGYIFETNDKIFSKFDGAEILEVIHILDDVKIRIKLNNNKIIWLIIHNCKVEGDCLNMIDMKVISAFKNDKVIKFFLLDDNDMNYKVKFKSLNDKINFIIME